MRVLILSKVILLLVPPMLTVSQVPVTVSVLFEPATFSDFAVGAVKVGGGADRSVVQRVADLD